MARRTLPVRVLLAVIVIGALVPATTATTPSLPIQVAAVLVGEPAFGDIVTLRVSFRLHGNPEVMARLHASPLVDVLDDARTTLPASSGTIVDHEWRLRANGRGFWSLALSATTKDGGEPYPIGGSCCGFGWSEARVGAWDPYPREPFSQLPDPGARGSVAASVQEGRVHLSYEVSTAPWLGAATLQPQVGPGSISAPYSQRAISLDHAAWETDLDVPPGGEAMAYASASYWLTFPRPAGLPQSGHTFVDHGFGGELQCHNMRITRDADRARIADTWACQRTANTLHGAPSLAAPVTLVALACCLLAHRLKG